MEPSPRPNDCSPVSSCECKQKPCLDAITFCRIGYQVDGIGCQVSKPGSDDDEPFSILIPSLINKTVVGLWGESALREIMKLVGKLVF